MPLIGIGSGYAVMHRAGTGWVAVDRKRAYFWSLLGDWTLKLSRPVPGEGKLKAEPDPPRKE